MAEVKSFKYRSMPFQIKYKKDLNVMEQSDATVFSIVNHFARNGYENLYLGQKGRLSSVLTLDDLISGKQPDGLNREFIRELKELHTDKDIIRFFIKHPYIDRITIVDNGELVCEVDGLIELPLQNGTAKNRMTLRYADIFREEISEYFEKCGKILLIADKEVTGYLSGKFPSVQFDAIDNLELLQEDFQDRYEVLIDFIYSKNIRKAIGFEPENLVSMSQLMMGFALKRLIRFCRKHGVHTRFYRVQNYRDLTCMSKSEYDNCMNRVKTGRLVLNTEYMKQFLTNDKERIYLENREYHASLRLDNGYCFIQDECNEPSLYVHKGIRRSVSESVVGDDTPLVHFFGPCTTYGFLVPDEETIPSLVEKYALEKGIKMGAVNQAGIHGYNELNAIMEALATPVRSGDFMVFYDSLEDLDFSEYPNAKQTYEWFNSEKKSDEIWFLDFPGHCGFKANRLIARHVFGDIEDNLRAGKKIENGSERMPYIGEEFDRFENMRLTHSSCIKFFQKYKRVFFDTGKSAKTGAVVIPDSYDAARSLRLAEIASEKCDRLYILKFNDSPVDISLSRKLFTETELMLCGKEARVLQPGYFFDSSRYLPERTGSSDCSEDYFFTERAFINVILKGMGVSVRVSPLEAIPEMHRNGIEEIYHNAGIEIVYV